MKYELQLVDAIPASIEQPSLPNIKIAYMILVHRFPEQFKRLFNAIYDPENCYLIHIDKKAGEEIHETLKDFLKPYTNVFIFKSQNVIWGGYSMVQAELDGMRFLLDTKIEWDYFINLSGQDFPLRSQKIIREFLSGSRGKNFIKVADQKIKRPDTMNRIEYYFEEVEDKVSLQKFKRKYLDNVTPYIGGQWMMLTRDCCSFICNSTEVKKFEDYYKNTLIADESFFQTVLMNTSYRGILIDDDKRAIVWIPDGDIKLRPKTFTITDYKFLSLSDSLFARKFDDTIDNDIINKMKLHYNASLVLKEKAVSSFVLRK
ncbi:MAG: glycosyl transferase [Chryseobacterium sp.]|nr:MAG: glycosyl transferase [Chryseobacterium sp.]